MTTDVETALELVAAAVAGMALLIALLVVTERVLLRPPAAGSVTEPVATAERTTTPEDTGTVAAT